MTFTTLMTIIWFMLGVSTYLHFHHPKAYMAGLTLNTAASLPAFGLVAAALRNTVPTETLYWPLAATAYAVVLTQGHLNMMMADPGEQDSTQVDHTD